MFLLAGLSVHDAAAGETTIGPMTVTVPPDWTLGAGATADRASFRVPAGALPQQAIVHFEAAASGGASQAVAHRQIWGEVVRMTGNPTQQRSGQSGRFVWSEMRVFNVRNSQDEWHRLYSALHGEVHVGVAVVANAEPAFTRVVTMTDRMLGLARFGAAPAGAPSSPRPGSPATVPSRAPSKLPADSVPIVEAHVHVDIRSVANTSNVLTDHILFFANGIVAREGAISGPRECYALYDVRNLTRLPFNYGRWREDKGAGVVHVQWQEGPPWTLAREATRLSLGGKKLLPLRALDNLRLDGVYEYRPVGDPRSRIELHADGRFTAANLREQMGCPTQARPGALAGAGHYEVRQWTLILRFADDRVTLLPLHVAAGEDLQRVGKFLLNGYEFVRVR